MQKPTPEVAFMAAALVLMVLPLLGLFGVMSLGLAAGLMVQMNRLSDGNGIWLLFAVFMGWVAIVVAVVLALVSRLMRKTRA